MVKPRRTVKGFTIGVVLLAFVACVFIYQWNHRQATSVKETPTSIFRMMLTDGVTLELRSFTVKVDITKNKLWWISQLVLYDQEGQNRVSSLAVECHKETVAINHLHYDDSGATMGTCFNRNGDEYILDFTVGRPLDELDNLPMVMPKTISGVISGIPFTLSIPPIVEYLTRYQASNRTANPAW